MEATEIKVEQGFDIRIKGWREEEISVMNFFCLRITQKVSSFGFYEG